MLAPPPGTKAFQVAYQRTRVQRNRFDLKRGKWRSEPCLRVLEAEKVRDGGTENLERVGRRRIANVGMRRSVGFSEPALVPRNYYSQPGRVRTPKLTLLACRVCSVSRLQVC